MACDQLDSESLKIIAQIASRFEDALTKRACEMADIRKSDTAEIIDVWAAAFAVAESAPTYITPTR